MKNEINSGMKITETPLLLEFFAWFNRQQNYSGKWILKETQSGITQMQFIHIIYQANFTTPLLARICNPCF